MTEDADMAIIAVNLLTSPTRRWRSSCRLFSIGLPAIGRIKSPSHVFLRVRATMFVPFYIQWTLACTNGTRTETTSDEGLADLPLNTELPIGIAGARSCSASASGVANASSNTQVKGTVSVELLNKP